MRRRSVVAACIEELKRAAQEKAEVAKKKAKPKAKPKAKADARKK